MSRVLHVVAPARAGGLETVVLQLTTGLRARGHDARVATVLDPADAASHPFSEALEEAGVPVHRIVVGTREYRAERAAIAKLMRAHDVDVLHTHGYRPDVVDGGVARSLHRAHVTTLHGFVGGSWRGRVYEWLQVRAAVRADALTHVANEWARREPAAAAQWAAAQPAGSVLPAAVTGAFSYWILADAAAARAWLATAPLPPEIKAKLTGQ
jgi:glycosyltransferase involved in cell wall biosynthesis